MYRKYIKHVMDFIVSLLVLILISPVLFLITLFLLIGNNGKPFFYQKRPGKHGKLFIIIKFRTMNNNKDKNGFLLPDSDRLTAFGKFLRKISLDELPQLINVIQGDMSLVGPRPLLPEYLSLYNMYQAHRHEVRPGITGWAQVNGRNAISWQERFELDVWYVDNLTFCLDIKILFLTLIKVFKREGISSVKSSTMERFTGSSSE